MLGHYLSISAPSLVDQNKSLFLPIDEAEKCFGEEAPKEVKSQNENIKEICQCHYENKFAVDNNCQCYYENKFAADSKEKCGSVSIKASVFTTIAFFIMYGRCNLEEPKPVFSL